MFIYFRSAFYFIYSSSHSLQLIQLYLELKLNYIQCVCVCFNIKINKELTECCSVNKNKKHPYCEFSVIQFVQFMLYTCQVCVGTCVTQCLYEF